MSKIDEYGREILDDTPVAIPARLKRPETLTEQIQRLIRFEASRAAENSGMETFEEADDFFVDDDDYFPTSPHELSIDQELEGYGNRRRDEGENRPPGEGNLQTTGNIQPSGQETPETPTGGNGTDPKAGKP